MRTDLISYGCFNIGGIVPVFIPLTTCRRDRGTSDAELSLSRTQESLLHLHTDQPSNHDDFQRKPFANRIARTISRQSDPAPLVLAINGAWGEGKSTVFGFLRDALKVDGVPVLEFNAWKHSTEAEMLRDFFIALAETLDDPLLTKGEKVTDWAKKNLTWFYGIVKEGSKALPVPELARGAAEKSIESLGEKVTERLTPGVDKLRQRIRTKLSDNAKRVAVLIDDPDRLDDAELFALLRLVKLTADFDYVTFVLAMDCTAVAKTIGRRFGGDDEEGQRFLEKIVQVPLRLPAISRSTLMSYTITMVNRVLKDLEMDVTDKEEIDRFQNIFQPLIMPRIRTPRAAKHYANVLRFTLGLLPGEVNTVDVILLEGLRLYFPETFKRLSENVLGEGSLSKIEDMFLEPEKRREALVKKLLPEGIADEGVLRVALGILFPQQLSNQSQSEECYLRHASSMRVTCDEYFLRYLACAIPETDVADAEIEGILDNAKSKDASSLVEILRTHLASKAGLIFIRKLRIREDKLNNQQRITLALAIGLASDAIPWRDSPTGEDTEFGQSAIFVAHCVREIENPEGLEDFVIDLLANATSLEWACCLVRFIPMFKGGGVTISGGQVTLFTAESIKRFNRINAKRIEREYSKLLELPTLESLYLCVRLWVLNGDTDLLRKWSRQWLERMPDCLPTFVTVLMQWSYSNDVRFFTWPGDQWVREMAPRFFDVEWLISAFPSPERPEMSFWREHLSPTQCVEEFLFVLKGGNHDSEDSEIEDDEL